MRALRSRLDGESGFSIIEAMVAITVLAVGAFAVSQSISYGLTTSGLARNRLAARAGLEQEMELARALNYDSLVLDDVSALSHSTDPNDPDYWMSSGEMFDPDGSGPLAPEPIVREAGASPALHHIQTPYVQGNTTFHVYMYVTWFDSPTDGLGGSDEADGNADGVSDASGQDGKRVVVVVTWTDVTGQLRSERTMSLFSDGLVPYHGTSTSGGTNTPPTVACPLSSSNDLLYTFTANATDTDGTVTRIDWKIYDATNTLLSSFANQGATLTYQFQDDGLYYIVNDVTDNGGGTGSNDSLDCNVTAATGSNDASGNGGPSGTVVIAGGAIYSNVSQVTLTLSANGASRMQFSEDGSTWSTKVTYNTTSLFTLSGADGTKTVYARFWQNGQYGPYVTDTIILDRTAPGAPTNLVKDSSYACTTSGSNKTCRLAWAAPVPIPGDLAGYRVYVRNTNSSIWAQQACDAGSGTVTCVATQKKNNNYEFYVVSYDNAGNESAQSNHITIAY